MSHKTNNSYHLRDLLQPLRTGKEIFESDTQASHEPRTKTALRTSCSQRLDYQNQKQRIPILMARLSSEQREYHPPKQNYRVASGQDCWSPSHRCHLSVSMSNPALESRGKGAVIMPYSCPAKKKLKTGIKGRLELELYSPKLTSNTSRSILKTILKQVWTYFTD